MHGCEAEPEPYPFIHADEVTSKVCRSWHSSLVRPTTCHTKGEEIIARSRRDGADAQSVYLSEKDCKAREMAEEQGSQSK
ncbi:hypothetical protein Y032_0558g3409 [Ancylostoma ceylanicum]|uniref:Uncharacterized protein n=1 Tax=Ancylostoma ceylanicum TaxID=53326 RepID=A0A016WQ56_9BILA|nr:hypothetical protein Y032_0558g3409 [Ancylostoma ceylanicum]